MSDSVAVDCCWLVHVDGGPQLDFVENIGLMHEFHERRAQLLLDHEGHIQGEYDKHVRGSLGRQFVVNCIKTGRVSYVSGKLSAAQHSALDKISFDPSDRPYLGVAHNRGGAPFLTDEEKHLQPHQVAAVANALNVPVVDTRGARVHLT